MKTSTWILIMIVVAGILFAMLTKSSMQELCLAFDNTVCE